MESLLFGINTVLPIFLLIVLGIFLKKIGLLGEDLVKAGTALIYNCVLPVNLFRSVSTSDFQTMTNYKFILLVVCATLVGFLGMWLLALKLCPDREKRGVFIHGAFRGNYVYVGFPITQSILNKAVVPCTALIVTFIMPLYNMLGVLILTYYNQTGEKANFKKILVDIIKNPLTLGVLVALPFSFFGIQIPKPVGEAMDMLGKIASPLSLLFIGASIRYKGFLENLWLSMKAAILKVVIQPLIFVPIAIALGFSAEEVVACYVLVAVPSAMNTYVMARKMDMDEELASGIIAATLVMTVITIPVGVMIMKGIGLL